ncbi:MAG: hypothetical protein KDE54_03970 [Caldilineaceae bacterium]|nr:hypothetical protein [Caldilineaceae bacterium]
MNAYQTLQQKALGLAFILLGVGLLWKGGIPRWAAGLLIVSSVLIFIGVNSGELEYLFTLSASVAYLAALAPIGLRYWGNGSAMAWAKAGA